MNQKTLEDVIKTVRVSVVADVCGVSQRAIYKWMDNGKLPRTEYTGETNYAEKIAHASNLERRALLAAQDALSTAIDAHDDAVQAVYRKAHFSGGGSPSDSVVVH